MQLSVAQQAHVKTAFPECRNEMAAYLEQGADVVIIRQRDCGDDVPPFAIAVHADKEFWIDCADTPAAASKQALALGLNVVQA